jgi:hypothetical protein
MLESNKQKKLSDILQRFNRDISKLMKVANAFSDDDPNLEWITRIIKIIRNENPPMILEKCIDKFWDNKDSIMNRDVVFFKSCSFDKYVKKDKNKVWIDGLINVVRTRYFEISEKEQSYIWDRMNEMLKCVIEYKLVKEEFRG